MVSLSNHEAGRTTVRASPSWFDRLTMKATSSCYCCGAAGLSAAAGFLSAIILPVMGTK